MVNLKAHPTDRFLLWRMRMQKTSYVPDGAVGIGRHYLEEEKADGSNALGGSRSVLASALRLRVIGCMGADAPVAIASTRWRRRVQWKPCRS